MQRNAAYALKVPAGHTAHIGVCGVVTDMEYIPAAQPISDKRDVRGHIRSQILAANNIQDRKQARTTNRTHGWFAGRL